MFQKNDIVLYGTHSVCRIEDISELRFNKDPATYYILKPVYRKESTIFVPVANAMLSDKMHAILTLEEVEHLLHIYRMNLPVGWKILNAAKSGIDTF